VTFLLDVNVLIALLDPDHIQHSTAHDWFAKVGSLDWATCPIVENGAVRILGNPKYPFAAGQSSPTTVASILRGLREASGHRFWPDDVSIFDDRFFALELLLHSRHITDSYLLALAVKNGGRFATFDRRLRTEVVRGGQDALHVIGAQ